MIRLLPIALVLLATTAMGQDNPAYDKALADSMKGDQYGMKMYVLVMLKTGSATLPKPASDSLFKTHFSNMEQMVADKKLVVAGPMAKNDKNYRGIFILDVKTIDEAKALLLNDGAVKGKLLDAEYFQWYGSAALRTYLPNHDKIQKSKM